MRRFVALAAGVAIVGTLVTAAGVGSRTGGTAADENRDRRQRHPAIRTDRDT
jgi:hypothetical protein